MPKAKPVPEPMTGAQYSLALLRLDLNQVTAADFLQISVRSSHAYANDTARIPHMLKLLLELMVARKIKPKSLK